MLDFKVREEHNPDREYLILLSKRKRYDAVQFYLAQAIAEWNDVRAAPLTLQRCGNA